MSGAHVTPEEMKKHVRGYLAVFVSLLFLTFVTVAVASLHLPVVGAVLVALAVATTKATLVALFFMHLIDEKHIIYWTLGLTGLFFLFVMTIGFY